MSPKSILHSLTPVTFTHVLLAGLLFLLSACADKPSSEDASPQTPTKTLKADEPATEAKETPPPAPTEEFAQGIPAEHSLQPFRDSWIYPTILNFRPAKGAVSTVNPPRFSWPYLKDIVAEDIASIPPTVFTFQLSKTSDFANPTFEVKDIPFNFYNAQPVLESGTWYWRVGYGKSPDQDWTEARSFEITPDAVVWDRSAIEESVALLKKRSHPRIAPSDGNWGALYQRLQNDPATQQTLRQSLENADRITQLDWWNDFPESDSLGRAPKTREEKTMFIDILKDLTNVAYVYRLTGDPKYRKCLEHIVTMATWPQGGLLSPEGALGGHTKMPSQAAELFAVVYDMFYDTLNTRQKDTLKQAVAWRLRDMYLHADNIIWQQGDRTMRHYGLAYVAGSHPYQNYAWTIPAILLMVGEIQEADNLLPFALHYLTGVTAPDGSDEGYNEGHGYSNEKGGTLLTAAVLVDMLLPELQLGKNPVITGLEDWFIFMFPGADNLPWGDSWLKTARGVGGENLLRIAYLTGSPLAKHYWNDRSRGVVSLNPRGMFSRTWFEFATWDHYKNKIEAIPEAADAFDKTYFLPEAGWVFVQSQPIKTFADYYKTVGMQFQMRPRGGYGHSYPSDGSFAWYAYGQVLSSGGGWTSWASSHFSRSPMSHNSLLVNGKGHDSINHYQPQRLYTARPLAFEEGDNYVYWAADLTQGYKGNANVERVHRHVLFIEDQWFLLYDDFAVSKDAEPAIFSWLFHVYQNVPLEIIEENNPGFRYSVGRTQAEVRFANPINTLAIENRMEREGYKNPITGEDHYEVDMARARGRGVFKPLLSKPLMKHNLWVTSANPQHEFHFLSALTAAGQDMELPEVVFEGDDRVKITDKKTGKIVTVSFNPAHEADIQINLDRVRHHAETTYPKTAKIVTGKANANISESESE